MPNVEYEAQWQSQKLNKSFQQELEQMKQEVYYEGLQVEEEGLTDIVRKKTKLHDTHFAELDPTQDSSKSKADVPHKNDVHTEVTLVNKHKLKYTTITPVNIEINLQELTDTLHEIDTKPALPKYNVTIIDNDLGQTDRKIAEQPSTITPTKNSSRITLHLDQSKIQSDSKDLVLDLTDNVNKRSSGVTTTTAPNFSKSYLESSASSAGLASAHKRHHRRRRQGRSVLNNSHQ